MNTQIIAFTGYKRTGKSTAAKYLIEKHGFVRHNFKDALVAEIKEKFPDLLREIAKVTDYREIDNLFLGKPPLMRALLQNYGTEVRRAENPDYWVNEWKISVLDITLSPITRHIKELTVVDDVRFLNEAKAVKALNGTIIRLTRPDIESGGDHSSETEQLQIEADYTIELEVGNEEKLYRELDKILTSL